MTKNLLLLLCLSSLSVLSQTKIIVLDPGHGYCGTPFDQNCFKPYTRCALEIQTALDVSLKVKEMFLKCPKTKVFMTRTNAEHTDAKQLGMRVKTANTSRANVFLSIHCNALGKSCDTLHPNKPTGTETFYCWKNKNNLSESSNFSRTILELMADYGDFVPRRSMDHDDYMHKGHLGVLKNLNMPGILSEIGFVDSKDREKLESTKWQDTFALAYYEGIHSFLKMDCHQF